MSHAFAVVLVPPDESNPEQFVANVLAPHEEWYRDDDTYGGWWDWYRIGGRWDGVIQGLPNGRNCPECEAEGGFGLSRHHYDDAHNQLAHNIVKAPEVAEMDFYRIVCPDGTTMAKEDFSRADQDGLPFDERDYTVKEYPEFRARALVTYRDHLAVGVDYHS